MSSAEGGLLLKYGGGFSTILAWHFFRWSIWPLTATSYFLPHCHHRYEAAAAKKAGEVASSGCLDGHGVAEVMVWNVG